MRFDFQVAGSTRRVRLELEDGSPPQDGDVLNINGETWIIQGRTAIHFVDPAPAGETVSEALRRERRCLKCAKEMPARRARNPRSLYCSKACATAASTGRTVIGQTLILRCRVCHHAFSHCVRGPGRPAYCSECRSSRLDRRDQHLRWKYGIGLWLAREIAREQLGRCPICLQPISADTDAIDHDHSFASGDRRGVRGIVHCSCNVTISRIKEDRTGLISEYLENPPARRVLEQYPED